MVPWRITFITNPYTCNLRCGACFASQAHFWPELASTGVAKEMRTPVEMDFAVIERVVSRFAPLGLREIIPSTMGEPFLYSRFARFLTLAAQCGLGVNVTTNGTFPGGGVDYWAPMLLPVLTDIKFSVMGYTRECEEELQAGLDAAERRQSILRFIEYRDRYTLANPGCRRPTVSLQFTVQERNRSELPALRAWANAVGIDRVKENPVWQLGRPQSASMGACPFLNREAWVWVDGALQLCPNPDARYTPDFRHALGDFGSFAVGDPLQVWQSEQKRRFVEDFPAHGLCATCPMRMAATDKSA